MSDAIAPLPALPAHLLADEVIALRLIRRLGPENIAARSPEARFLACAPEYRFAIHRRQDEQRVGRIHLRRTLDPCLLRKVGHLGYAVQKAHRRQGYATRAIRRIIALARYWQLMPLWVLIEPSNIASRKAAKRTGFQYEGEADTSAEAQGLGMGPRLCHYVLVA